MDKDKAREKVDELKEKASHAADVTKEKASHAKDMAKEKASKAADVTKEKAKKLAEATSREFHKITDSPEFRSITPLTWTGVGLTVAFALGMLINTINLKWWLMLPIAGVGIFVLHKQWLKETNKKTRNAVICLGAMIALAALFVWRDIQLSQSLVAMGKAAGSVADEIKDLLK